MFHTVVYEGNNAGPANNFDLTAATDTIIGIRNGHLVLVNPFNLLYAGAFSTTISDARILSPSIIAINPDGLRLDGLNRTAGISGSPTKLDVWTKTPIPMPTFEELQFQASTGVAELQWIVGVLGTPNWSKNLIKGADMVLEGVVSGTAGTNANFTPVVNTWSGPQFVNFNQSVRAGVYIVKAATVQLAADLLAFRLIFPQAKPYAGRILRPGWFAQNAVASFEDIIQQMDRFHLGDWGAFHPFEPVMCEVYASTAAAMQPIIRLWCTYIPGDFGTLDQVNQQLAA
jgi:hypothetical protein